MRELLEEARDRLLQNTPHRPCTCVECDNNRSTIAKITVALAEPEPDAMEVVDQLDHLINDNQGIRADFDHNKAAALIEDYGRRVPRAMLEEIWELARYTEDSRTNIDEIAAKHGIQVEDAK